MDISINKKEHVLKDFQLLHFAPDEEDMTPAITNLCSTFTHIYTSSPGVLRLTRSDATSQIKKQTTAISWGTVLDICLVHLGLDSTLSIRGNICISLLSAATVLRDFSFFVSSALFCLNLSLLSAEDTPHCFRSQHRESSTDCNHTVHIHGVYIYSNHRGKRSNFPHPAPSHSKCFPT